MSVITTPSESPTSSLLGALLLVGSSGSVTDKSFPYLSTEVQTS